MAMERERGLSPSPSKNDRNQRLNDGRPYFRSSNVRKKISQHPLREEGQPRRGHGYQRPKSRLDVCVCEADLKMSDTIEEKIKNYRTAPFDARFPNTNQTRNCFQNYLDYHRCNKALDAKGQDLTPCQWYMRVYKSLCPMSWVAKWDDQIENGSFPGKI